MKRVLYLCNHKTLMNFEIKILQELGYEVYAPKKPFFDVSCGINWELDKTLSIPTEDIDILNNTDFFYSKFSDEVVGIINKYFEIAIVVFVPFTLREIVTVFEGAIVFRAFGLDDSVSYSALIETVDGYLMEALEKAGNRFFFASGFRNMVEPECRFLKTRERYMPIGYAGADHIEDKWLGGNGKILISCPRIKINSYFFALYKNIKKNYGDLPHSISGVQPFKVEDDPNVVGSLPEGEYQKFFSSHSCFLYPTNEKRHLHYTPFEAIHLGVPLLFMAGGVMDELGGLNMPGRCLDVKDARRKAKRLIEGDRVFAEEIRKSQPALMKEHAYDYCKCHWQKAMAEIEAQLKQAKIEERGKKKVKVAVILPEVYLGGVLDYSLRLTRALKLGAQACGDEIEIVFAHLDSEIYKKEDYFMEIKKLDIKIRKFKWQEVSKQVVKNIYTFSDRYFNSNEEKYVIPVDGISDFQDCDFLLFTVDVWGGALKVPFVSRPYGMILHDFIARYGVLNENAYKALPARFIFGRNAVCCFTTTQTTMQHAIQYAGIAKDRVQQIPLVYDASDIDIGDALAAEKEHKYFLWSTNATPHKNHLLALAALSDYYAIGGKLQCFVTGVETEKFSAAYKGKVKSYIKSIREVIQKDTLLRKNLKLQGVLHRKTYNKLLQGASFFFHPGVYDNGNGTCMDAAFLGVPTLSSDYPAMRFIDEYMDLNIRFFDAWQTEDITRGLLDMEKNIALYASQVPCKDKLKERFSSNEDVAKQIYKIIKRNLGW